MTPTPEQLEILSRAKDEASLRIIALAGAAKTSTLCMLAQKLPLVPTFCGAFNKRTAEDMAKRLPSHIQSSTMNSIGHRVWSAKIGKRLTVETDKGYEALKALIDKRPSEERKRLGENFASMLRAVRLAKSAGYVPEAAAPLGKSLCTQEELLWALASQIDCEADDEFLYYVDKALEQSILEAFSGRIDFDDQIYMSTLFGGKYPKFPIVMIDEAQDLSPLNHETIAQMFGGRLIAVGDPFQSIYAFRGAHVNSLDLLKDRFSMEDATLSVSFRCPIAVVKRARFRAPNMQYPEWAKDGEVRKLAEWSADALPDHAAVLCRNNAPLLSLAMHLIRQSRGIKLVGFDIGKNLITVLKKIGPGSTSPEASLQWIANWRDDQLKKAHESRKASIEDRAACLEVFITATKSLDEAIAYAERIFSSSGTIQLMTIHKSKGGEWNNVFHLDPWRIPSKHARRAADEGDDGQLQQELNLRYVAITRAQETYTEMNLEDLY